MAESPLLKLGRLVGGVVLMQGNLGHQVLGQLLVTDTNEVAIAAAFVVVAGATGKRNEVGQLALRTVAPALAARALVRKQEQRVDRKLTILEQREKRLAERDRHCDTRAIDIGKREIELESQRAALESGNRHLRKELDRVSEMLRAMEAKAAEAQPTEVKTTDAVTATPAPPVVPPAAARARVRPPANARPSTARKRGAPRPRIGRKKR